MVAGQIDETELRRRLTALTKSELVERFGGHGVRPATLKGLPKAAAVDLVVEFFGAEFPPTPAERARRAAAPPAFDWRAMHAQMTAAIEGVVLPNQDRSTGDQ